MIALSVARDSLRSSLRGRREAALARARFSLQRLRLRLDRWADLDRRPRIIATACWSFPIYSQTFVYQELRQLLRQGYALRFVYSQLERHYRLADQYRGLWRARRRLELHPAVCDHSAAWFARRVPKRVNAVITELASAAGMSPDEVRAHRHVRQAFAFARLVQAYGPAYLHSYFFYEGTLFTYVASHLLGIPRGVSCYADHVLDDYALKTVALHLRQCRLVVATSQRIRTELLAIAPTAAGVLVKPNGIDAAQFPPRERCDPPAGEPFRLVSVNRIEPKKGLTYLVDAVHRLHGDGLPIALHILGADDDNDASRAYGAALRRQVQALGLEPVVHFEGRRTQADVAAFFARGHIFVAPFVETASGDKDGVPTSLLEAMSSALPVVVTDAGSMPEVVQHTRDGLIVPQRDPAALADAIAALCRDAAHRDRLGANAAARVRREFDVQVCESVFHERLAHVLAQSPASHAPQPDPDPA